MMLNSRIGCPSRKRKEGKKERKEGEREKKEGWKNKIRERENEEERKEETLPISHTINKNSLNWITVLNIKFLQENWGENLCLE